MLRYVYMYIVSIAEYSLFSQHNNEMNNYLVLSPRNKKNGPFQYCTLDHPKSWFWVVLEFLSWNSKHFVNIFKQFRPWSEGSYRSPLIWVWTVWNNGMNSLPRATRLKGFNCLRISLELWSTFKTFRMNGHTLAFWVPTICLESAVFLSSHPHA